MCHLCEAGRRGKCDNRTTGGQGRGLRVGKGRRSVEGTGGCCWETVLEFVAPLGGVSQRSLCVCVCVTGLQHAVLLVLWCWFRNPHQYVLPPSPRVLQLRTKQNHNRSNNAGLEPVTPAESVCAGVCQQALGFCTDVDGDGVIELGEGCLVVSLVA